MLSNPLTSVTPNVQAADKQARKGTPPMTHTAAETDFLNTFAVPSTPESVRIARSRVRTTLSDHGLDDCADDICAITSELVTNAAQHAGGGPDMTIEVRLLRIYYPAAISVIVKDSSPEPPVKHDTAPDNERGRGLRIVEALSDYWGWHPENHGKAVFAIVARGEQPSM
jgi:anti-sigma regulatory factor (Ser/Thr protein kinase)